MNTFDELVEVMRMLRGEGGCPRDREQTHQSLKPYLIEEAYEVLDAIDREDDEELKKELGDLLLQVVFHARIAEEEGRFGIDQVAGSIVEKLKRRHPHVFGDVEVSGSEQVLQNWEDIKNREGRSSVLDGVPASLPALLKARRVQEKVSRVGFDWEAPEGALDKVSEEIEELKGAARRGSREGVADELGDVLFSLVNVSRFLRVDAEEALGKTVRKFMKRFRYIEERVAGKGDRPLQDYSLEELDSLWEESKKASA
ncbi:MAG: nucleoside triphosphate pyrophosphohydrolase [Spirochaetota bacterium]